MKVMTKTAYKFLKKEISKCNAIKVNSFLKKASCKVCKCYSETDDILVSKPMEIAVINNHT